jgi:acyl carrier protein
MTREAAQSIEDVVKNIIVAELRVERSQLVAETHLMKDLGADSLDALNIALRLEEAFKIKIPDDAIPRFLTVGDIVQGVNEHLAAKQSPPAE